MGEPWDILIRILVEYKLTTNKVKEVGEMVSSFKYRSWPLYRWSSNTFSIPSLGIQYNEKSIYCHCKNKPNYII